MREFQEKQKIRRRVYSRTSIIALFVLCILVAKGLTGVYAKERSSRIEVERLDIQKKELEEKLILVSAQTEILKTEKGIESEIRNKFDVVKVGERVLVVVDKELPVSKEEKEGVLRRFWHSVTGVFRKSASQE